MTVKELIILFVAFIIATAVLSHMSQNMQTELKDLVSMRETSRLAIISHLSGVTLTLSVVFGVLAYHKSK